MTEEGPNTKPFNVRLPIWAVEYIDRRSEERGVTKTQVVLDALSGLRAQELQELMREGYAEMSEVNRDMARRAMSLSRESLSE